MLLDNAQGGPLHQQLRCRTRHRKRDGSSGRRGHLGNRTSIDERPAEGNEQQRVGDWEVDTILGDGQQQALVTLTERRSRLTLLQKITWKTAEKIKAAVHTLLAPLAAWMQTMTSDNGKACVDHARIT